MTSCDHRPVRLFCLPYAGGSARMFLDWSAELPSWIDVVPLELPGRGLRIGEPACADLAQVVDDLRLQVTRRLDRPFAVFGHSLGAMLGFELIQALGRDAAQAVHFFPSGAGAPHIPSRNPSPGFSDEHLRTHIRQLGGTAPELVDNDEWMAMVMPVLRADFTLADTYLRVDGAALDCPVTAFCGDHDVEAPPADVLAWRRHARASFAVRFLPGDHFFVQSARRDLLDLIVSELCPGRAHQLHPSTQTGTARS